MISEALKINTTLTELNLIGNRKKKKKEKRSEEELLEEDDLNEI